jgi:phosphate acetyltransferase
MLSLDPELLANLERAPARVAIGDASDARVREALHPLVDQGVVRPVLVAPPAGERIPDGVDVVGVDDPEWVDRCVEAYLDGPNLSHLEQPGVRELLRDPLMFGAVYVRLGGADAGMAGSMSTSASVVRAGIFGLGVAQPGGLASGCFLMQGVEDLLTFADCSVVPDPTAEQLADIAVLASDIHRLVTGEAARTALLSFSTDGSARHPKVEKVRTALELARARRPDLEVDGEMQFDVAVMPHVAAQKFPASTVGGRANVFVFPDLDAGNIGYKMAERFGGRRAIGSIVMGLRRPWIDLSRGCSTEDIVDTATVAACLARAPRAS